MILEEEKEIKGNFDNIKSSLTRQFNSKTGRKSTTHNFKKRSVGDVKTAAASSQNQNKLEFNMAQDMDLYREDLFDSNNPDFSKLKILILGGTEEIGRNCFAYIFRDSFILADCGVKFQNIDSILLYPNLDFIQKYRKYLKGVFVTHAHEDHSGGLITLIQELNSSIKLYISKFGFNCFKLEAKKRGLLEKQEFNDTFNSVFKIVNNSVINIVDGFSLTVIENIHSTPGSFSFVISTNENSVLHTGDWKYDLFPGSGFNFNLKRLSKYEGKIDAIVSDSTKVTDNEFSRSERDVIDEFESLFQKHSHERIFVTIFGSNVQRSIHIVKLAKKFQRKVFLSGFSLVKTLTAASQSNLLDIRDFERQTDNINNYQNHKVLVLCTGSQGQENASLFKMALNKHKQIKLNQNDVVVYSSSAVPGNELNIKRCIHLLMKKKVKIYSSILNSSDSKYHASGHGSALELLLLFNVIKPRCFIPVHGDFSFMYTGAELAHKWGMLATNQFLTENGSLIVFNGTETKHFRTPFSNIYIDQNGYRISEKVIEQRMQILPYGLILVKSNLHLVGICLPESVSERLSEFTKQWIADIGQSKVTSEHEITQSLSRALSSFFNFGNGSLPKIMFDKES